MFDHGSTFAADATDSLVKREKMRYNNSLSQLVEPQRSIS